MPTLLIALFLAGVTVQTHGDLKFDLVDRDLALTEWTASHVGAGAADERLAKYPLPLRFAMTQLTVPQVSAFAPMLRGYLERELARGWRVSGLLEAPAADGSRRATFTRSHDKWEMHWPVHGRAQPVACPRAHADAVGCFLVSGEGDGAVKIELGAPGALRLTPKVLVALTEKGGQMSAQTEILALLQKGDADRVQVPAGELGDHELSSLTAILAATLGKTGSAWRFEGRARFAVKPVPPKAEKAAPKAGQVKPSPKAQ